MRECPESREKRPLKMAALYKRLTFELIFNLAICGHYLAQIDYEAIETKENEDKII